MPDTHIDIAELREATDELGKVLYQFMTDDSGGTPGAATAAVFARWVLEAGPISDQPDRFADVIENYNVQANTNKDLFNLFSFLQTYLTFEDDAPVVPEGKFIPLRVLGSE